MWLITCYSLLPLVLVPPVLALLALLRLHWLLGLQRLFNGFFTCLALSHEEILVENFLSQTLDLAVCGATLCEPVGSGVLGLDFVYLLLPVDSSHGVFVELNVPQSGVVELTASLANNFEAFNFGFVVIDLWR